LKYYNKMAPKRLVRIAKFGEPFGIRGGIKVWSFFDFIYALKKGQRLYISEGDTEFVKREVILEEVREHNKGYVLYFEEFKDRTSVEKIRGNWLLLEEDLLPPLPEGYFYSYQIIGLQVYNTKGDFLGVVREIIETGSNDVFVVESDEGEMLLPFIRDIIREVNIPEGKIVVEMLEEL